MPFHEHHHRTLVKTITYRVLIIVSNGVLVYLYTSDFRATADVIGISSVVSTAVYFFHERAWNRVHWGKKILQNKKQP